MRPESAQPTNRVLVHSPRPQQLGRPEDTRPEETHRDQGTQTRQQRQNQDIQIQLNVISNTNVVNNPFEPPIDARVDTEIVQEGNNVEIFTDAILNPQVSETDYNCADRIKKIKDYTIGAIAFCILVYLFVKEVKKNGD